MSDPEVLDPADHDRTLDLDMGELLSDEPPDPGPGEAVEVESEWEESTGDEVEWGENA